MMRLSLVFCVVQVFRYEESLIAIDVPWIQEVVENTHYKKRWHLVRITEKMRAKEKPCGARDRCTHKHFARAYRMHSRLR